MTYKDIVVHLDQDEGSAARLDAAIGLAGLGEGRVIGVHVRSASVTPEYAGIEAQQELLSLLSKWDEQQDELETGAERLFNDRTVRAGTPSEWRLMQGDPVDAVTACARHADIAIVGQAGPHDGAAAGLADSVVLGAGGPVLVWPHAGSFDVTPGTVMLAWNGTREAKRALADSLPLLRQAGKVIVIGINTGDGEHIAGADACAHLARHGVNAEPRHILTSPAESDSASLLSAVKDSGAGLLVMGAYGHHRMRELLLGGMTRDLLRRMTVPVLMSH